MAWPASSIENHWGWTFIPFLQGFGGNVFRNPPDDLMPTLDTPEAVEAAEFFAKLINTYGPEAAAGYTYDQVTEALRAGRVNYSPHNHAFCALLGEEGSKVGQDLELRHGAEGTEGPLPGVASHGWGIPVGAKNKEASWEFIKWSMSKEFIARLIGEARAGLGHAQVADRLGGLQAAHGDQRRRYRQALPRLHRHVASRAT